MMLTLQNDFSGERLAGFLADVENGDLDAGGGQRLRRGAAKARGAARDDGGDGVVDLHGGFLPVVANRIWQAA